MRGPGNQPRSHCSALLSFIFLQPSSSWCCFCCCCCCARNMCVGRKLERSSKSWRKWQMGAEVIYVGLYLCICTCTARCSCCVRVEFVIFPQRELPLIYPHPPFFSHFFFLSKSLWWVGVCVHIYAYLFA